MGTPVDYRDSMSNDLTVGILHPGQMGAAVGEAAASSGRRVLWASERRSALTVARAATSGLEDVGSIRQLVTADVVISVCPPQVAGNVAREVVAAGFGGLFVDANATSPDTSRVLASIVEAGGGAFVDGGIIGFPPHTAGTTRIYLSGVRAGEAAQIFSGSLLEARVVGIEPGVASALKMAYAGWTKGSSALILAVRALARAEGVEDHLLAEWALSQPDAGRRTEFAATINAPKAWRFAPEMIEIADTFEAVGVPDGFWRAAAEVYERLAEFKDRPGADLDVDKVFDRLSDGK
jgi:3-hydroxyisobutyrate dehydrogenase-like beta-hydroxyacid dehydrogenase